MISVKGEMEEDGAMVCHVEGRILESKDVESMRSLSQLVSKIMRLVDSLKLDIMRQNRRSLPRSS